MRNIFQDLLTLSFLRYIWIISYYQSVDRVTLTTNLQRLLGTDAIHDHRNVS